MMSCDVRAENVASLLSESDQALENARSIMKWVAVADELPIDHCVDYLCALLKDYCSPSEGVAVNQ